VKVTRNEKQYSDILGPSFEEALILQRQQWQQRHLAMEWSQPLTDSGSENKMTEKLTDNKT